MISIMRRRFVLFCFENVATKRVEENKCQHLKRLKWQTYWDKGCRNTLHFDSTRTDTKLLDISPSWAPYERRQAGGQSSSGGCSWPRLCTWLRYLSALIWLKYLSTSTLLRYLSTLILPSCKPDLDENTRSDPSELNPYWKKSFGFLLKDEMVKTYWWEVVVLVVVREIVARESLKQI